MTAPQTLRDLMISVGRKTHLPPPERYLWIAVWWHLYSRETATPEQCLGYARGQLRLAKDMAARPDHYSRKSIELTDWQWSGLATTA